jgi:hypothetical protein
MGICQIVVGLLSISVTGTFGVNYDTTRMENYCSRTITLPCPSSTSSTNRGGTLQFYYVPTATCSVKVTLSSSCYYSSDRFAIYVNIKESKIGPMDSIEIYENNTSVTGILLKKLSGGTTYAHTNPSSAGQFRTQCTPRPTMTFKYIPGLIHSDSYQAVFDYNILQLPSNSYRGYDYYCSALNGYVHKDLMCDTNDRVNCPSSYSNDSLVYGVDWSSCSSIYTTRSSTYRTRSSTYTYTGGYYYYSYWSGGVIAGIVIGSIGGIIFIAAMISLCVRASRNTTQTTTMMMTSTGAPVVVGGYQPSSMVLGGQQDYSRYPVQSPAGIAPPPSYSSAAYSASMPQPAMQPPYPQGNYQAPSSNAPAGAQPQKF